MIAVSPARTTRPAPPLICFWSSSARPSSSGGEKVGTPTVQPSLSIRARIARPETVGQPGPRAPRPNEDDADPERLQGSDAHDLALARERLRPLHRLPWQRVGNDLYRCDAVARAGQGVGPQGRHGESLDPVQPVERVGLDPNDTGPASR